MERAIAISVTDAKLIEHLLGNEKILGEYSVSELVRLGELRANIRRLVGRSEQMDREWQERGAV